MILVVGATGLLGGEICRLAREKGLPVSALVRKTSDPSKVEHLKSHGCEILEGDLKDPASLDAACQGITTVISTASSTLSRQEGDSIQTVDHDGQLNLIEAAEKAGVNQFIFISFPDDPEYQNALNEAKRAAEKRLAESKMNWVALQANYFMEVWLSPALGFNFPEKAVRIYGDGTGKNSWVSFLDVAKIAVASIENTSVQNKVLSVGGPEALSPLEVIEIFETLSGEKFQVEKIPVEALEAQKNNAGNPLEAAFACLMLCYAKGWTMGVEDLKQRFDIPLMSVQEYAQRMLGR